MNWYEYSQKVAPIQIIHYNRQYGELGIMFTDSGKQYVYPKVSPFLYNKIRNLLGHMNFSEVGKILQNLSKLK